MLRAAIREFQARRDCGETTAQVFTEACLAGIAARNAQLNAFVCIDAHGARAAAGASDERRRRAASLGPLDGVPFAIKDNFDVAGLPAASGIGALRARTPLDDASCIARLRAQGAVLLGKTLMDEAALGALGDNPFFGRCRNPLARGCTAGGSSSGSAVAVAAGLCMAALGTDTLGSVRIPASYCGIVGYVPGRGLIDAAGVMPLAASLDRVGVLTRSVADAALVAEALCDSIRRAPPTATSIGVLGGLGVFVPAEILGAVDQVASVLARDGHRVVEVSSGAFDWTAARRAAFLMAEVEGARVHAALLDDPAAAISPALRAALEYGRRASPERIERARAQLDEARAAISSWLERCDVLLLPTTPQAAFAFDTEPPPSQGDLTAPASIAGLPAISLPAGVLAGGLPVGAQLLARQGRDAQLLGVAASLD
jgi:aspartyl-tRNA(Asn)/glutamyl-tRNA(Gln) amidotransferase subunit A